MEMQNRYPRISGIYEIRCINNDRRYIGRSINLGVRFSQHLFYLVTHQHGNKILQDDFDRYGYEHFSFSVLELCETDLLSVAEAKWIASYPSNQLYNVMFPMKPIHTDDSRFINYINRRWLVPKGIDSKLRQQYRIWKEEDKCEIIDMAYSCKMFDMYKSQITFNRVVGLLENCLGYEINVGRAIIDGDRQTYRLVISYDEESNAYVPVHKTINDLSFKIA